MLNRGKPIFVFVDILFPAASEIVKGQVTISCFKVSLFKVCVRQADLI